MTEQGFIKLHRSILSWEWWDNDITLKVFLWLLLNANWEDSRFQGYVIPKGSLVTSYDSISRNLKISPKQARTAIKHLKRTGEVAIKRANKFSIVSIANWEKFQCYDEEGANKRANEEAFKGQSKGNIKEYKEYKNKRNDNKSLFASPYDFEQLQREIKNGKN